MTRSRIETWPTWRALALLAALWAVVVGALLPFAAMAASTPGHPIVLCSAEGPKTIQLGSDVDGPGGKSHPASCAACVMALAAALPAPAPVDVAAPPPPVRVERRAPASCAPPPPARAPPRPPSTAPPLS